MDDSKWPCLFRLKTKMIPLLESPDIFLGDSITPPEFMEADLSCVYPTINIVDTYIEIIGNLFYCEKSFVFH